jgi:hypothetical protein
LLSYFPPIEAHDLTALTRENSTKMLSNEAGGSGYANLHETLCRINLHYSISAHTSLKVATSTANPRAPWAGPLLDLHKYVDRPSLALPRPSRRSDEAGPLNTRAGALCSVSSDTLAGMAVVSDVYDRAQAVRPRPLRWLGDRDSNPDSVVQSHVCCPYTIPQRSGLKAAIIAKTRHVFFRTSNDKCRTVNAPC